MSGWGGMRVVPPEDDGVWGLGGGKRCVKTSQAGGAVWGKTQGWESPGRMGDPSQPEA